MSSASLLPSPLLCALLSPLLCALLCGLLRALLASSSRRRRSTSCSSRACCGPVACLCSALGGRSVGAWLFQSATAAIASSVLIRV